MILEIGESVSLQAKAHYNTVLKSERFEFVLVNIMSIIYNKLTRCRSGSIVFIESYKYALHVSDALCAHLQEHYKL